MSFKNQLQEQQQAAGRTLPAYQTDRVGGTSHRPQWRSEVTVDGKRFTGATVSSKKEAEQSAAYAALSDVGPDEPTELYRIPEQVSRIVMIDLENVPVKELHKMPSDVLVNGYVSKFR